MIDYYKDFGNMTLSPGHGCSGSLLNKWDDHHTVDWEGGHIKFFSVKTLSHLLTKYTYKIISFHYYGRAPFLWKNMICLAQKAL
jgi:hypothetical protein